MIPQDLIVVIGRTFGSGGRRIGKLLAQRLNIKYYDRELLSEAADRLGLDPGLFIANDERCPSPIRSLMTSASGITDQFSLGGITSEHIYALQSRVIRDIADRGPCVIVGRSADYILREHPHLVSVFLHSPLHTRAAYIMARGDAPSEGKARDLARSRDRAREKFYNYFTGRRWGAGDNYHMTLDSSLLSDEAAVSTLIAYIESRFDKKDAD